MSGGLRQVGHVAAFMLTLGPHAWADAPNAAAPSPTPPQAAAPGPTPPPATNDRRVHLIDGTTVAVRVVELGLEGSVMPWPGGVTGGPALTGNVHVARHFAIGGRVGLLVRNRDEAAAVGLVTATGNVRVAGPLFFCPVVAVGVSVSWGNLGSSGPGHPAYVLPLGALWVEPALALYTELGLVLRLAPGLLSSFYSGALGLHVAPLPTISLGAGWAF